jgi:hypothetical protein
MEKRKKFRRKPLKSGDMEIKIRFQDDFLTVTTHTGDILEAQESNPMRWYDLYDAILKLVSDSKRDLARISLTKDSKIGFSHIMQMLEEHGFDMNDDGTVSYPEKADSIYYVIFKRDGGKLVATRPFRFSFDYNAPVLKRNTNIHDDVYNEVVEV